MITKIYKDISRFLIDSNLWVALAIAFFTLAGFQHPYGSDLLRFAGFVGFSCFGSYHYMRVATSKEVNWKFWLKNGVIIASAGVFALLSAWKFLSLPFVILLLPAAMVTLFYPIAFPYPFQFFTALRYVPGLKLFLISFVWVYVSYVIPSLVVYSRWLDAAFVLEVLWRVLFVVAITIPFDYRDLANDPSRMETLPMRVGAKNSLVLAQVILFLIEIYLIGVLFFFQANLAFILGWLVALEFAIFFINRLKTNPSPTFVGIWIEAIPILVVLGQLLFDLVLN